MKNSYKPILLLLPVLFILSDCSKKDDRNTITSSFYFQAEINGQKILLQDKIDGYGSSIGHSGGTSLTGCVHEQSFSLTKATPNGSAGVIIIKTFQYCPTECSEVESMFSVKSYNFGKRSYSSDEYVVDGVVVYYVDNDGIEWATDKGSAVQTNSSFAIVEHIDNTVDYYSEKISKAKFQCTLYNDSGESKSLANGEIRGRSVICMGL